MKPADEYEIVTVADFQKVPSNRLADCLTEFVMCQLESRNLNPLGLMLDSFVWIDDGTNLIREAKIQWPDGMVDKYTNPNFRAENTEGE